MNQTNNNKPQLTTIHISTEHLKMRTVQVITGKKKLAYK